MTMEWTGWWNPVHDEWTLVSILWTEATVEETWVKTALRSVAWKKWWNPVDEERKLVSIHWTEDTVEETWANTGGHNNQLAMNADSNDDGKSKCHNWIMQRLSALEFPEDRTIRCYKVMQRLDAPFSPEEVHAARASGKA